MSILDKDFKIHAGICTKEVQEHAFKLGYTWHDYPHEVVKNAPFIHLYVKDKSLAYVNDFFNFSIRNIPEINLTEFFSLKPEAKPKHEFKPHEPVLVRNHDEQVWYATHFSHYLNKENYYETGKGDFYQCIPATEENSKLAGTTDKPKE